MREKAKRIRQAIRETDAILEKERRYLPQFQNRDLIGRYEDHRARLVAMLEQESRVV